MQQLHVVSDFRERAWKDQKAIASIIEELSSAGVTVNLVKTVPDAHANLAVTELSGAVQVAAAGVPLRLKIGVTNFGSKAAADVRVSLSDDNVKLPLSVMFDAIEAKTTAFHEVDVRLTTPTQHRLAASIDPDALPDDNTRYLAVDVTPNVPVLIIDGQPNGDAAGYVSDALAADPQSTGISPTLDRRMRSAVAISTNTAVCSCSTCRNCPRMPWMHSASTCVRVGAWCGFWATPSAPCITTKC